jgi:hypothetical protein
VKHAFTEARQRPGGINLRLERLQAHIWWQGKSGMLASQLPKQIRIMLQFEDPPSYLVVHVRISEVKICFISLCILCMPYISNDLIALSETQEHLP